MFSQVSYNVVVERFKAFAAGHYLIKRFSHGQIDVTDIMKDAEYPWMHIVPVSMNPSTGIRSFSFDIIFADLPRDKEDKTEYQRESLSDCIRLAEDLLAEIQNGNIIFGQDVELEDGATIAPFMEEYTHVLTGVTLSLTMTFPWDWNACEIPSDWSAGGSGSGGTGGGGGVSLILKVNNVENNIQTILNLVQGANMTITDLGDGRVQFDATGDIGINWGSIGGILANQTDLQDALDLKVDIISLAAVATSGDYNDLSNTPTIPDSSTFVPYTGATSNVNLGGNSFIADDGSDNSEMSPTLFGVQNAAGTKYSYLDKSGLNVSDSAAGDTMIVNAGGLTFPDATSQSSAAVNSDWNATSGLAEILNKPTIPSELRDLTDVNISSPQQDDTLLFDAGSNQFINGQLGAVAYSNDYNDLDNLPSIPPVIGDMTKAVYDTDNDGVVDFAKAVKTKVRNSTGAVLHKGHIVYLSGSTGNLPNARYAQANNDANSAQTFGVVYADIPNNGDGFVVMLGAIDTLDTRTTAPNPFTSDTLVDGQVIYLSPTTAGHITNVKPSAPNHLVYVGYVIRTSPTNGTIEYRIQNGYELDELHDVSVPSPSSNDFLYYDSGLQLWRSRQLTLGLITDVSVVGYNIATLPNPSAIRYLRINADNSVSALSASQLKSDLGFITQIQSTQLSNSSSSINVTISGCTIALEANTNYIGKMTIASGSVPVLGYTLVFNFPTGTTIRAGRINSSSTTAQVMLWQEMTSGVAFGTQFGNGQNQNGYAEIQLYISVGATAGNFTQDFRSGSQGSAITIYAGLTSIQLQKV